MKDEDESVRASDIRITGSAHSHFPQGYEDDPDDANDDDEDASYADEEYGAPKKKAPKKKKAPSKPKGTSHCNSNLRSPANQARMQSSPDKRLQTRIRIRIMVRGRRRRRKREMRAMNFAYRVEG